MKFLQLLQFVFLTLMFGVIMTGYLFSPKNVKITKEIIIWQSPSVTYQNLANIEQWHRWSPWFVDLNSIDNTSIDKLMLEGMTFNWGEASDYQGNLTVVSLKPNNQIQMLITMSSPMYINTEVNWYLESVPQGTKLTLMNEGSSYNGPLDRFLGGILSKRKMEKDFSDSLEQFKLICEL